MTQEELKKTIDGLFEKVKENFLKDKSLNMVSIIHGINWKDEKVALFIPFVLEMAEHKYDIMFGLGKKLREEKTLKRIEAIIFISESWFKQANKIEEIKLPISEQLDKKEAIQISGMNEIGQIEMRMMEIVRKKDEPPILTEMKLEKGVFESNILKRFWEGALVPFKL